jgi:hypothetical protein
VITLPKGFDEAHGTEVMRLHNDGFYDGCCYKNSLGVSRMIICIHYPIGVEGEGIRAINNGETTISFVGEKGEGTCSIADWY